MTPLAGYIVKQTLKKPWLHCKTGIPLMARIKEAKCFECTNVVNMANDLAGKMRADETFVGRLAFLPSPVTWLEVDQSGSSNPFFIAGDNERVGFLLEEKTESECVVQYATKSPAGRLMGNHMGEMLLNTDEPIADLDFVKRRHTSDPRLMEMCEEILTPGKTVACAMSEWLDGFSLALYAMLAIINSPRMVARKEHDSNKALERKVQLNSLNRSFRLQPWHEIVLDVNPGSDDGGPSGDDALIARISGPKALHFCRSFLRVRLGRLERVRAHWRGDASLGISRATYSVRATGTRREAR